MEHSKQKFTELTMEAIKVEDEMRQSLHEEASPESLLITQEKNVKCVIKIVAKFKEPKNLQTHRNYDECKFKGDKVLSCAQALATMSQATPTILCTTPQVHIEGSLSGINEQKYPSLSLTIAILNYSIIEDLISLFNFSVGIMNVPVKMFYE